MLDRVPALDSELPQMVIQMLVHSPAPILRAKRTKKRVRMPCALRFPTVVKLAQLKRELLPLALKIPLI